MLLLSTTTICLVCSRDIWVQGLWSRSFSGRSRTSKTHRHKLFQPSSVSLPFRSLLLVVSTLRTHLVRHLRCPRFFQQFQVRRGHQKHHFHLYQDALRASFYYSTCTTTCTLYFVRKYFRTFESTFESTTGCTFVALRKYYEGIYFIIVLLYYYCTRTLNVSYTYTNFATKS